VGNLDYERKPTSLPSTSLHWASLATALCTLVLIFIGGLVTSHKAGMSVPDWPNSYGYNMFLFPPSKWVGGILFEHTHRLMGTVVGFCATMMTLLAWAPGKSAAGRRGIALTFAVITLLNLIGTGAMAIWPAKFGLTPPASDFSHVLSQGLVTEVGLGLCVLIAWFCRNPEPRRWVRWLATACLLVICVQGLLGGLRVDLINLTLAMIHGCFAQASFCLIVLAWIVTGEWWTGVEKTPFSGRPQGGARPYGPPLKGLVALAVAAVIIVYGQLILGAVMRHLQAGLAIPDLPLAYGHWLPPTSVDELHSINTMRVLKLDLEPVTLGQIWLHYAHRMGAIVVSVTLIGLIVHIFRKHRDRSDLTIPATVLAVLLATQVTLGILTVYWKKPADVASLHVATGALVLVTSFLVAVRALRLYFLGACEPGPQDRVAEATTAGTR
jgi:cytochrome c oxidase assembly protein subunit 15